MRCFETVTVDEPPGVDVGRVVAAGDPERVGEQPAGPLDAAHGGDSLAHVNEDRPGNETLVAYVAMAGDDGGGWLGTEFLRR